MEYLSNSNFKWSSKEQTINTILNSNDDDTIDYLFDVHLHYPEELHDLHHGHALAPENKAIKKGMLS